MGFTNYTEAKSEEEELVSEEWKQMILSLPKERGWRTSHLYEYQGFWCQIAKIQAIANFQKHFQSFYSDVVLASIPKSGTTWLKALAFAVTNRDRFSVTSDSHPLLTSNPHDLVPFFEYKLYANNQTPCFSNFFSFDQRRLFGTHIPYPSLADSIKTSNCRIVYICRNPFDCFVSTWHFLGPLTSLSLEEAFEMFCQGIIGYGPFWEHMLGYWKESLERPEKGLFLMYEELKEDPLFHLKRLAKFLKCPFSLEEERSGVVEKIKKLCSFQNLKELEVNKKGKSIMSFENEKLFRKGEVGDWVNCLSPQMVERLSKVIDEKLGGSSLKFNVLPSNMDK
ncbi:hypothetical protein TIFTF001_041011 [Ficus carica]|uniref:Sulfotransferase n=1 Tax=Ficus carica TaxID=3494 RepID=A0AA87Z2D5_FICCA|nr:hypothetical protein TIFTF001_041011 [Ficus carica]